MGELIQRKILIGVDGSEPALEAIRYVARTVVPHNYRVVLFHVLTRVPESFWDAEQKPAFHYKIANIKTWEEQQEKMIDEFMAQGRRILSEAGLPEEAVVVKIQDRKAGIARDILSESENGYDAVVVGRKGLSELKDLVLGSIANKLVERLSNMPVWLVGQGAQRGRFLVSMDASEGALRAVQYLADMLRGSTGMEATLFHVVRGFDVFQQVLGKSFAPGREGDWIEQSEKEMEAARKEMGPSFQKARALLKEAGVRCEEEDCKIVRGVSSRAGTIVEEAEQGGYDTIVIGRRGLSRVQEFFMGRVSNKVIQLTRDRNIWIVN